MSRYKGQCKEFQEEQPVSGYLARECIGKLVFVQREAWLFITFGQEHPGFRIRSTEVLSINIMLEIKNNMEL